ncbi:MAG: hypothetical protein OXH09_07775, partial [Gammaproteobacteria bacterium]|nr:hypothetical protein [Gammaproteobacteria bacterium]
MVLGISGRLLATSILTLVFGALAWGQDADTDEAEVDGDSTPEAVDEEGVQMAGTWGDYIIYN